MINIDKNKQFSLISPSSGVVIGEPEVLPEIHRDENEC
jgi:hypothetical protein